MRLREPKKNWATRALCAFAKVRSKISSISLTPDLEEKILRDLPSVYVRCSSRIGTDNRQGTGAPSMANGKFDVPQLGTQVPDEGAVSSIGLP
jgi:hypothetical protein